MARKLTFDICGLLKLDRDLSKTREPEPDPETAWRYCQAYFDQAPEAAYAVVCRSTFEARLRVHISHGAPSIADDDPAWYALRHVIYATGCRYLLSKQDHPASFVEAQRRAWQYFQNALSVHTDLLFVKTSILAVQALAAMVSSFYLSRSPIYSLILGSASRAFTLKASAVLLLIICFALMQCG
jgi:hypothetical protein